MDKKPSIFRKIFKVILSIFIILLAAMIILPFIFKDRIIVAAKEELNKNLDVKVDFEDFGLSLFTSFPNFNFHLDGVTVVGIGEFEGDTLANISTVSLVINIVSVMKGDAYEIQGVRIVGPDIYLKIAENGMANWDIVPEGDEPSSKTEIDSEISGFNLTIKKFEILDANITYEDVPGNTKVFISDMNHSLSGNFSADKTSVSTRTIISGFTFEQGEVTYLNNVLLAFEASIDADLKNEIYTFKKNELSINELVLQFDGSVAMAGGDPNIILTFNAPKNSFKNFLSLIPAIYQKDFQDIQTSGDLSINGFVKGTYTEASLPSFRLDVVVDKAMFQYPGLPASVKDINMVMNIDNPGGDVDNTTIDIRKFHFSMVDNPFDLTLLISTPISDPFINAGLNGRIDLSAVSKVYPLEKDETITGLIDANIKINGRLSAIENQAYTQFEASGSLLLKEISYAMSGVTDKFEIGHAQMNFSPAYIDLVNLDFTYAASDLNLKGKIENYLPYALGDQELKGNFTSASKYFNANQFISDDSGDENIQMPSTADTVALAAFSVPANIDFKLNAAFDKILYDNMELENVKGFIFVKDEKVSLSNLKGNLFDGTLRVNGSYDTRNTGKPIVDFEFAVEKINFQKAFITFGILQKFAPIFKHGIGNFSTNMSFNTLLNEDMSPDWMTFIGEGLLNTSELKLENVNTLNKLSEVLKMPSLQALNLNPLKVLFDIKDGKLMVKPFDMQMKGMKANLSGWTAFDQSIEYVMKMEIPMSVLGGEANNVVSGLVNQANASGANFSVGETVDLDVLIGGTLSNPTVKPAIGNSGKGIIEGIKNNIQEELKNKKEELEKNVKAESQKILNDAELQAQKVIDEAQKQANKVIAAGKDAAQKIKAEADVHANKLIEEGKKNGMLAEVAAKKAADEYKKKAGKEADNVIAEANKQSDSMMNAARQKAAGIRSDAQKKVDSL